MKKRFLSILLSIALLSGNADPAVRTKESVEPASAGIDVETEDFVRGSTEEPGGGTGLEAESEDCSEEKEGPVPGSEADAADDLEETENPDWETGSVGWPAPVQEKADNGAEALEAGETSADGYTYTAAGDNVTITGYTGSLTVISVPKQIEGKTVTAIGSGAFSEKTQITAVILPDTVENIGNEAFKGCTALIRAELPGSVKQIGKQAFVGCTALQSLTLPNGLTTLGACVIEGTAVSSITVPSTVRTIVQAGENGAFANCGSLTEVIFEEGMKTIPAGICSCADDCANGIKRAVIPEGVTEIGAQAFMNCKALEIDCLPGTVGRIQQGAFSGCQKITSMDLKGSALNQINGRAFFGCTALKTLSLPGGLSIIGESAFSGCTALESLLIPDVTTIGNSAFAGCTALRAVRMSSVKNTFIGVRAFSDCTSLSRVELSNGVTDIKDQAFFGCRSLRTLVLPEDLTSLGQCVIEDTAISSIRVPAKVKSVVSGNSQGAFSGCNSLKEVIFDKGLTRVPSHICAGCTALATVAIPESVTAVDENAFLNCARLTVYGYAGSYAQTFAEEKGIPFKSVGMGKDIPAESVIEKLNLENLLKDIRIPAEEMEGPTVTIAGKTFPLFKTSMSAEIKLSDKIQAKVDGKEKTVQILIGVEELEGSDSPKLDPSEKSSGRWKQIYDKVKSLNMKVSKKETIDSGAVCREFKKLRNDLSKIKCSVGVDASMSLAGYMEFSYASGKLVFIDGGAAAEMEVDLSKEYRLPPCPVGYVTFGIEADFNGKLSFKREQTVSYMPAMEVDAELLAVLAAGAGSKIVSTYAEIGLEGGLGVKLSVPSDSLAKALLVKLTAKAYFESKVFGFDGPNWGPQEFTELQLYPKTSSRSVSLFGGRDLTDFALDRAAPSDRSYLNAPSALRLDAENTLYSKSNLYRYNGARLVCLNDGTMLLVWVDDDGSKSDVNKTSLMYAVYDGTSWSGAQAIAETGGASDYPYVCTDGEKALIVWQKAARLPADAGLPDVLQSAELYAVTYENGRMGAASAVTSGNTAYEMQQRAVIQGGRMAVVWVENSENNPYQAEGTNTVKISTYADGKWTEPTAAVSSPTAVSDLNIGYVGEELVITYGSSADSRNVITMVKGGEEKSFTGYNAVLSEDVLYYCTDAGLAAYDIGAGTEVTVLPEAMSDYTVIDNGSEKMIVMTEDMGFASELAVCIYDRASGKWSDKVTLTKEGRYIRSYSPVLDRSGNLTVALNLVDVAAEDGGTVWGNAELRVMSFSDAEDLVVEEGAYFEEELLVPGGKLPLNFSVTNNGMKEISRIQVEILDDSGQVLQSGAVPCAAGAGETADVCFLYRLSETVSRQTLTIRAYTEKETDLSDNTVSVVIGDADIAVGNLCLVRGDENKTVLRGEIRNIGYSGAFDVSVAVYVRDEGEQDATLGTKTVDMLAASGSETFEISIPDAYLNVNPLIGGNRLYVEVSTVAEEMNYGNNRSSYLIRPMSDEPLALNHKELVLGTGDTQTLEVTFCWDTAAERDAVCWESEDEAVATVENGTVTAVGTGETAVTATVDGYTAACKVTVRDDIPVTGICLDETSIRLAAGETRQLAAHILPETAGNQGVMWESADVGIASVDPDGLVRAVAAGTTEVTAVTAEGYRTAVCRVTVVREKPAVRKISFSGGPDASGDSPSPLSGAAGTHIILPDNPYVREGYLFAGWTDGEQNFSEGSAYRIPDHDVVLAAVWNEEESVNYLIAASAHTGGRIEPAGEVTVAKGDTQAFVITADDGYCIGDVKVDGESAGAVSEYIFESVSGNHTIEAVFQKKEAVLVQKIELDRTEAVLEQGQTLQLEVVVLPENAENRQLLWSSSNSAVATVSAQGLVTAVRAGTAAITVAAQDGSGVSAVCTVTVSEPQDWGDLTEEDRALYNNPSEIPENFWLAGIPEHTAYTGKAVTFALRVYDHKTLLAEKMDYTISYKNNKNAADASRVPASKAPTVIIKGRNNFTGTITRTFTILPADIGGDGFRAEDVYRLHTGKVQKAPAVLYQNGRPLKKGRDYVLSYEDTGKNAYTGAGSWKITITGRGNYTGTRTVQEVIGTGTLMRRAKVSPVKAQEYTGEAICPVPEVTHGGKKLTGMEASRYEAASAQERAAVDYLYTYADNREAGSARLILTGVNDYFGQAAKTFQITGTPLAKCILSGFENTLVYTGAECTQDAVFTAPAGSGKSGTLTGMPAEAYVTADAAARAGVDYTYEYQNYTKAGRAAVIYRGVNGYSGTLKKTYRIADYDLKEDSGGRITVAFDASVPYAKGGAGPEPVVTFRYGGTSRVLTAGTDYTVRYVNHKAVSGSSGKRPELLIQGRGNFTGRRLAGTFSVVPQDIGTLAMTVQDVAYKKKANIYRSALTVTDRNGKKLVAGTDYEKTAAYEYAEDTAVLQRVNGKDTEILRRAGDPVDAKDIIPAGARIRVTVTGRKNYSGTLSAVFRFTESSLAGAKVTVSAQYYTGRAIEPDRDQITVKVGGTALGAEDYEIIGYANNRKKGTAQVMIRGIGNYGGTKTVNFRIQSRVMSITVRPGGKSISSDRENRAGILMNPSEFLIGT